MTDASGENTDGDPTSDAPDDPVRLAFLCVQNAGRSQMATAFAERERAERGLEDEVDIVTGGTDPADEVHEGVVEAMAEVDVDLADREPREIDTAELEKSDVVATMGCSTLSLDVAGDDESDDAGETGARDATEGPEVRDWPLPDPHGEDIARVREIRRQVRERVTALFDEVVDSLEAAADAVAGDSTDADDGASNRNS